MTRYFGDVTLMPQAANKLAVYVEGTFVGRLTKSGTFPSNTFATMNRDSSDVDTFDTRGEAVQHIVDSHFGYEYEMNINTTYQPNRHTYQGANLPTSQRVMFGGVCIGTVGKDISTGEMLAVAIEDGGNPDVVASFSEGVEHVTDVWFYGHPNS